MNEPLPHLERIAIALEKLVDRALHETNVNIGYGFVGSPDQLVAAFEAALAEPGPPAPAVLAVGQSICIDGECRRIIAISGTLVVLDHAVTASEWRPNTKVKRP